MENRTFSMSCLLQIKIVSFGLINTNKSSFLNCFTFLPRAKTSLDVCWILIWSLIKDFALKFQFFRWSFLGLGILYGAYHQQRLSKREVGIRAIEEQQKSVRDAKLAEEKKRAQAGDLRKISFSLLLDTNLSYFYFRGS